jgi:SAM-dependent methyltransferase
MRQLSSGTEHRTGKNPAADRSLLLVFGAAICLGAGLVFLVQPMVAKMILPLLGGSPAVWNTSMLFFQAALLAGYAYAHYSIRHLGLRRQPVVHLFVLLLPLLALPVALPNWAAELDQPPALRVLVLLAVSVGGPFFAAATAGPLLQRWFSATGHPDARDPYFLYAAGNVGSLAALVGYPLAIEPGLSLHSQAWLWSGGYALFALLALGCALALRRGAAGPGESAAETEPAPPLSWRQRAWWVLLAFIPSSLMLGTTTLLTTDVAPVPLLWVLPLALYLLSFVLVFSRRTLFPLSLANHALPPLAVALVLLFFGSIEPPIWVTFLLLLATLFCAALVAHGRLAAERPPVRRLTEYFLLISTGGVLGGVFNALAAPQLFDSLLEYPLTVALLLLVRPAARRRRLLRPGWAEDALFAGALFWLAGYLLPDSLTADRTLAALPLLGLALAAALLLSARPAALALVAGGLLGFAFLNTGPSLHTERTFFGVYEVYADEYSRHVLTHGTTRHGSQSTDPETTTEPLSYFHRGSPIGQVFHSSGAELDDVAVVGLGTGALAAYGEPGQRFVFYEIDPAVVEIARDPELFTYLLNSPAEVEVVVGDGRLELERVPDGAYDLIVLDAFSSAAIPMHLLTREAVETYAARLSEDGIIAFHITNRHLGLEPVLAGAAAELEMAGISRYDPEADYAAGTDASHWVLLAREARDLEPLAGDGRWQPLREEEAVVWTDDFSDLLSVFYWD